MILFRGGYSRGDRLLFRVMVGPNGQSPTNRPLRGRMCVVGLGRKHVAIPLYTDFPVASHAAENASKGGANAGRMISVEGGVVGCLQKLRILINGHNESPVAASYGVAT